MDVIISTLDRFIYNSIQFRKLVSCLIQDKFRPMSHFASQTTFSDSSEAIQRAVPFCGLRQLIKYFAARLSSEDQIRSKGNVDRGGRRRQHIKHVCRNF